MRTRRGQRRIARLRRRMRPEFLLLAAVIAAHLAFQTWQQHRLDRLRQERVEVEERLATAQAGLAAANFAWTRHSAQDEVVARARQELGFVDSRAGERLRLALPGAPLPVEEPLLQRLAAGLDRFSGIRSAGATEDER